MDELELPPFVLAERDALLAEIYEVFPGGSRAGGVSWSESRVIDDYGSPEERAAARARDRDTRWQELVDDPNWCSEPGIGGWSFLDAIGFRYYLPAAMIRSVQQGWDVGLIFHLRLPEGDLRHWRHDKWSLLNLPQRLCVKRFIEYMGVVDAYQEAAGDERGWIAALKSYWGRITNEGAPKMDMPEDRKERSRKNKS